jgi:hypothetical protein
MVVQRFVTSYTLKVLELSNPRKCSQLFAILKFLILTPITP